MQPEAESSTRASDTVVRLCAAGVQVLKSTLIAEAHAPIDDPRCFAGADAQG